MQQKFIEKQLLEHFNFQIVSKQFRETYQCPHIISGYYAYKRRASRAYASRLPRALKAAAPAHGLRVERVIFAPPLLRLLRKAPTFAAIADITFMETRAWFPHDGHYHVDFATK